MKIPVSWLRELVAVDAPTEELADRLSMTGTAVDGIDRIGGKVEGVVAAAVLEVTDVAESEKLCVAQVDAGPHGRGQVVAGAKNFKAGDNVAWARPGSRVTTLDQPLGVRTMAGKYESQGMVCSARELGVSEEHEGILLLDPEAVPGADVAGLLALDDDVLSFEIYPNRPDLMSVVGIAREVALLYGVSMRSPWIDPVEEGGDASSLTSVAIDDEQGCPRYLARIIDGVAFGPSPALVQARLSACGFRPLGNIVDATNYVLLLTGQPLHAFDMERLAEGRIVVRRARAQEGLRTLDGLERELDPGDLVIADARDAQAIAGVMGGAPTEVGPSTSRVLLESAYFDPISIARTARRFGMRTEASARFERGADPEAVPGAAALCAELIRRWAGGRVARGAVDAGGPPPRRRLRLRRARADAILGVTIPANETDVYLRGLGCEVSPGNGEVGVVVPSWRPDLEREIDLVEELARLYGYDSVPMTIVTGRRGSLSPAQRYRRRVREVLMGAGLNEAALPSFASEAELELVGARSAVRLTNPMTVDQVAMRPSLVPGLLRAAKHNSAHGVRDVRLFEIGAVFGEWGPEDSLPVEELCLAAIVTGYADEGWYAQARPVDAYDAKGIVELVLRELGPGDFRLGPLDASPFHPGRSAAVIVDGMEAGRFGELRPSVRDAFDIVGGAAVVELRLGPLIEQAPAQLTVRDLPRFPAVTRDISLVVGDEVAVGDVVQTIRASAGGLLERADVIDVYRGEPIPAGSKNLTFRLTLRSADRTLTSREADEARQAAAGAVVGAYGAEIR